jgi:glycosyltransferase involved in cell wall biosynthesis
MKASSDRSVKETPAPRILYVLSCWPHDRAYGGQIRALHIARALSKVGTVTLAIVGADPVSPAVRMETEGEFAVAGDWPVESTGIRGLKALRRSLTDPDFVNVHGLALAAESEAEIRAIVDTDVDLVWFFQLRTANYFRKAYWPGAVVDVDNLPSSMVEPGGDGPRGLIGRLARHSRVWQLHRHERRLMERFAVVAVCSEADRRAVGNDPRIHVIPNGFERPIAEPQRTLVVPPRIGFIGLLEYEPNRDGIRWFLEHCWPSLRTAVPGIRLRLAGKGGDRVTTEDVDGVDVLGWVEDAGMEMATWSLIVIPIFSGAGTRIKIADAFSRKCPVVSTRLGAYGYDVADGRELRLADTPDAFVAACVDIVRHPACASDLAQRAWQAYLQKWTWDAVAPAVWGAAEAALQRTFASAPAERPTSLRMKVEKS